MLEFRNRYLRAFSDKQIALLGKIDLVPLARNRVVYQTGDPITHLYCLESGLGSTLLVMPEGAVVEMWSYGGPYGIIGTHTIGVSPESLYEYRIRIAGHAWKVARSGIEHAMETDELFDRRMRAFCKVTIFAVNQLAACRAVHSVDQRFCRLLLTLHEALETDTIALSPTVLAEMVPSQRSYLYELARKLASAITLGARSVIIHDADALRALACGCFHDVAEQRARALAKM